jgi:hypothetical protein
LLDRQQELSLVAGRRQRKHADVIREVKRWSVHPERAAQLSRRYEEQLPETRYEMQAARDCLPHDLDPEVTIRVEQIGAVQYRDGTDVLGPDLVRPQHDLIGGGQPFNGHAYTSRSASPPGAVAR